MSNVCSSFFFFSSRRRHTRFDCDWSSDVCSSDLSAAAVTARTWGLAYLQANQLPQAEAEFEKVVKLAPDQAVGYADLGLVYLREGRYREAEAQLRRAAALDSADSNIALMLAKVYELTGRPPEAPP